MKVSYKVAEPSTIKEFIIAKISRNFYGYLKEMKAIYRVNNMEKQAYEMVEAGDMLEIEYTGEDKQEGIYSYGELDILYEDSSFIVVDKPPHLLTIPSKSLPSDSVYNRLLTYFKGTNNTIHIVNRLDKETQGLVLICKNKLARALLREFDKTYVAVTDHMLMLPSGTFTDPIRKSDEGIKRVVDQVDGDISITHYSLIKAENGEYTYQIKLDTGRTHQIRVHFSYYHCPIIGDTLYGGTIKEDGVMRLVCKDICFVNPFTKEKLHFSSRY